VAALPFLAELAATLYGVDGPATGTPPAEPAPENPRELFVAVAGHELRTPVTVIRGYADTLVEHWEALDEDARRSAVQVLGQRARDLAGLVDRVLTVAADVAGLVESARAPFELAEVLTESVTQLPRPLRAAVRMELDQSSLPKAIGDRVGVGIILAELVTNACKYSSVGVSVELTAGSDDHTVWFQVADRGVGVRPEHVERAFERFWQFDTGDQRRHGGVGLGLYLVRRIVERQDGWVCLRPRDGGGTIAEVRLPRADPILRGI
jgi:signal transduction histidine kinase